MRLRILALALIVPLAGACLEPLDVPNGRFGSVTLATYDGGPAGYLLRPEAAFYGETGLSYQPFSGDTCVLASFSDTLTGVLPLTLDAGEFLVSTVSGRTDTLEKRAGLAATLYRSVALNGFVFTPGDTFRINIPGAASGFPATAGAVRTAEPFTHGDIPVLPEGQPINVTWTAAPAPGSNMTVSLRYANSFSTGGANEQVYCSFIDDGAATISSGLLIGWANAVNDVRSTRLSRVRAREVIVDGRTRLSLISSFALPLTSLGGTPTLR